MRVLREAVKIWKEEMVGGTFRPDHALAVKGKRGRGRERRMYRLRERLEILERQGRLRGRSTDGCLNRGVWPFLQIRDGSRSWRDNGSMNVSEKLNVSATAIRRGKGRESEKGVNRIVHRLVVFVLRGLRALARFLLITSTIFIIIRKVFLLSVLGNLVRKVRRRQRSKVLV